MGYHKRKSDHRLKLRLERPTEDRVTLLPCPACDGSGRRILELEGRYRMKPCRWCHGSGAVEHGMIRLFSRWRGILAWNRARGTCPETT